MSLNIIQGGKYARKYKRTYAETIKTNLIVRNVYNYSKHNKQLDDFKLIVIKVKNPLFIPYLSNI